MKLLPYLLGGILIALSSCADSRSSILGSWRSEDYLFVFHKNGVASVSYLKPKNGLIGHAETIRYSFPDGDTIKLEGTYLRSLVADYEVKGNQLNLKTSSGTITFQKVN